MGVRSISVSFGLLRQTLRRLVHDRGFSATILVTLALCIGANVTMYAVIDAILLRALPYPHADRLVIMRNSYPGAGVERGSSSLPNYYNRRGNLAAIESLAIHQVGSAIIGQAGSPNRVRRDRVSPEFFETLGVPIAVGRTFKEDEMLYANAQVLILTHEFWQTQFNGDPDVLGRELVVDGLPNTVVGVLPPGFRYLDSQAKFFIPLASNLEDRAMNRRHSNGLQLIGRLREGATLAQAQQEVNAFNEIQLETDPFAALVRDAGFRSDVYSLHADTVRQARAILLILQAGAFSLLLIGCVNLVNLLLIRTKGRAKEMAVRQSLGAGRRHLAKETAFETLLLALGGGVIGLGIGAAGIRLLKALGATQLPLGANIVLDSRVALVSLAGSALVGLALAVPVIVANLRRDLAPALQAESRGGTVSRAAQAARHGFIVAQVALAFALLAGAGLLGLSLKKVLATSPGFRAEQVLTASVALPWKNYPEPEPRQAFLERLLGELRALPGVTFAGVCDGMPFSGSTSDNATVVEGVERAEGESIRTHYTSFATGEYWQAMGIPLVEGRFLEDADQRGEQRVCLVDDVFAQRYWPEESALGRRIASDVSINEDNAITIVGVVGTVKQNDLTDTSPLGSVYLTYQQRSTSGFSVAIRTPMAPDVMGDALRNLVLSIDPELPVDDVKVMQDRVDDSLVAHRSPALLAGIFASVALLLAAIGTYGVLAYAVTQRRREIGVRIALGASPSQVLRQFFGLGARLLLAGVVLGVVGTWLVGLGMQRVLFEVTPFHLGVVAGTAVIMCLVVLIATLLPSQRAARVSPTEAMGD